ncbi:MAG: 50S ribosomal protein L23 [Bacteroidota bacterium]|nr:50S ribosomal protein L23 [Bacteroidota bacterium]
MSILIKPIITEKATTQSEDLNVYAFEVARSANKVEIKRAVEDFYGVKVETVRTSIVPAKFQTKYTKSGLIRGRKSAYKKALVKVVSGESIDLYGNI